MQHIYFDHGRNPAIPAGGSDTVTFPILAAAGIDPSVGGYHAFVLSCNNTAVNTFFDGWTGAGTAKYVNPGGAPEPVTVLACVLTPLVPPNPAEPNEVQWDTDAFAGTIVTGPNTLVGSHSDAHASWGGGGTLTSHIAHVAGDYDRTLITALVRQATPLVGNQITVNAVVPGAPGSLDVHWKNFHSIQGKNWTRNNQTEPLHFHTEQAVSIPWAGGPAGLRTVNHGAPFRPDICWLDGCCEDISHYVDQGSITDTEVDVYTDAGADSTVCLMSARVHSMLQP